MGRRRVRDDKYQHEIKIDVKVIRSNQETEVQEVKFKVHFPLYFYLDLENL